MTDVDRARRAEPRAVSLTTRLAVAIMLILLAGGVVITLAALSYGHRAARDAFDRLLVGAANQIAASIKIQGDQVVVDIPPPAFELLALAREDRVAYRVMGQDGETITGYDGLPPPGPGKAFYETEFNGATFRLAVVRRRFAERRFSGTVDVIVGHTTRAREALAREIARSALVVLGVAGLCMIGLAAFAIHSALKPLRRVERSLRDRDPHDLTPLDIAVPAEARAAITAINRFMARIEAQVSAMDRLIADSAHQLRTPVAALRAQAELAAEEADPERQREIVARIHARSLGLSRLTDQLLSRALIIHRADAAPRERLDMRTIAIRTAEESSHDSLGPPVDLRLDLPERPVRARGDPRSLIEACKNLVNNALRYGAAPVTLEVAEEAGHARIAVRDLGPGLPEALWPEAGARFSRPDSSAPEGAGLGLAIVREVAKAHDGELRFGRCASGAFEAAILLPSDQEVGS